MSTAYCCFTCQINSPCSDINQISNGIGDKFAIFIQYTSSFVTGFIVAFTQDWRLTLFMLAFTPILAIFGLIFGKITAAFTSQELKEYASAGAVAEEVLSSIRTVYAFGGEAHAVSRYVTVKQYTVLHVGKCQGFFWAEPI